MVDRLPSTIPAHGLHFPAEAFEAEVGSRIVEHAHRADGGARIQLAGGQAGKYRLDLDRHCWVLER